MSTLSAALLAELSEQDLDQLAALLAPRLALRLGQSDHDRLLSTDEAAEFLRCPRGRVYDLVQLGKLAPQRDGRRLLFRRSDLTAYVDGVAR